MSKFTLKIDSWEDLISADSIFSFFFKLRRLFQLVRGSDYEGKKNISSARNVFETA